MTKASRSTPKPRRATAHAFTLALLAAAVTGPASAAGAAGDGSCAERLDALMEEWRAISFPIVSKPAEMRVTGRGGHEHTGMEVEYMRHRINRAAVLCRDGREAEALVEIDTVHRVLDRGGPRVYRARGSAGQTR